MTNGKQETAEAYRAAVREELEESAKAVVRMEREQAVVKALVDASEVDVPQALVDQGLKLDRYLQYLGRTIDQWMGDRRPEAESRLKTDLVLGEFARREGLEPSDEEADKFLEEQAGQDEELKDQVGELKKSSSARRYFASRLRRRRVLDRLVDIAK